MTPEDEATSEIVTDAAARQRERTLALARVRAARYYSRIKAARAPRENLGGSDSPPVMQCTSTEVVEKAPVETGAHLGVGLTRAYTRRPKVIEEINLCAGCSTTQELMAVIEAAETMEAKIQGLRLLKTQGHTTEVGSVINSLLEKIRPWMVNYARTIWIAGEDPEDLVQRAMIKFWEEMPSLEAKHEFWTVYFNGTAKRMILEIANRMRTPVMNVRQFYTSTDMDGGERHEIDSLVALDLVEGSTLVADGLALLPDRTRLVVELKMAGYEVRSADPQRPTISSIVGVTDRTVRFDLAAARKTLINSGYLER